MKHWILEIEPSDWLGFLGTIIGSLVGGLIAYIISRSQVKQIKNENRIEEINNFFKVHQSLSVLIKEVLLLLEGKNNEKKYFDLSKLGLNECMGDYLSALHDQNLKSAKEYMEKIIIIRYELSKILEQIYKLNDNHILYEFYDKYQDILFTLKKQIQFVDTFIYHDNLVSRDRVRPTLDSPVGEDIGKAVQARMIEAREYRQIRHDFIKYQNDLNAVFKKKEKEKIELGQ